MYKKNIIINSSKLSITFIIFIVGFLSIIGNLIFYSEFGVNHIRYIFGMVFSIFACGLLCFVYKPIGKSQSSIKFCENKIVILIFEMLAIIGFFISIFLIKDYGFRDNLDFFDNLRHAKTADNLNYYGTGHLGLISLVLSVYFKIQNKSLKSYFYLIASLSSSLVAAERTSLLYIVIIYLGFDYVSNKIIKKFNYVIFIAIIILLFIIIAFQTNKMYDSSGVVFIIGYLSFPIEALNGLNLSDISLSYANVIGLLGIPVDFFVDNSLSVPHDVGLFNVYSYVYKPLSVFGDLGFFIIMFFLGCFIYILETQSRKSIIWLMAKLSFIFSFVMMFYDWTFNYYTHLYFILFSFLIFNNYKLK